MTEELDLLETSCRQFFAKECAPHYERWEKQGCVDREIWTKAGAAGLLCAGIPEAYGGAGGSFAHEAVIAIEANRAGISGLGIPLHNAIVAPYVLNYGSEEQTLVRGLAAREARNIGVVQGLTAVSALHHEAERYCGSVSE